ncbi:MAG TPA: hypothetical protein VN915_16155 [Elusimicrobiota bacterium]|nr:hypothetical protein [Elusimicrobiota bacterium]
MARAAAALFFASLLTGLLLAAAMTGAAPADRNAVSAAHLGALMGCFLLLGVAWTFPFLRYGERGLRRLGWAFIVGCYGNWAITVLKSFLHVAGVARTGEPANDAVFLLLTVFVVLPFLGGGAAWLAGFSRRAA